jgi:hypothetical protein
MSKAGTTLVREMEVSAARGMVLCCSLVLPAASLLPLHLLLPCCCCAPAADHMQHVRLREVHGCCVYRPGSSLVAGSWVHSGCTGVWWLS